MSQRKIPNYEYNVYNIQCVICGILGKYIDIHDVHNDGWSIYQGLHICPEHTISIIHTDYNQQ